MRVKNKIAILTETNSGLSPGQADAHGVELVPMPVMLNGETFFEDISMTQDEFYKYLEEGAEVMTSQPSPDILMKAWREQLAEYDEIVYIPMSSGLSSSCGTATMLSFEEEFEDKE